MELKDIFKFEPIDITHIAITFGLVLIIIYAFKGQLNSFFESLQHRPITVKVSGSETTIELDAPVKPELLAGSILNPYGTEQELLDWEHVVANVNNIEGFQKLGFGDLYNKLSSLNPGDLAVINYTVDDTGKNYFNDETMLKYLSIASEKIRYLAFYKNNEFSGAIRIEDVISGLASNSYEFKKFGEKIKNGQWREFPGLIAEDVSFHKTPSVRELYERLSSTGLSEIPLIENGRFVALLNHESISNELYAQVSNDKKLN